MVFKLPSFQDLSPDQEMILNLPLTGKWLITGPPGSGKTVMALHRAITLGRAGQRPTLIVYNKVLYWYLEDTINDAGLNGAARTFNSFFARWFRENYQQEIPKHGDRDFDYDWGAIRRILSHPNAPEPRKIDHLIVDEGQDFEPEFYSILGFISDNITIFADDNQPLTKAPTTVKQIQNLVTTNEPLKLTQNFRNSRQIAQVCSVFYPDTRNEPPELPARTGVIPYVVRYPNLAEQVNGILRYEAAMPRAQIGVLTGTNEMQDTIHGLLIGRTKNPLQRYQAGRNAARINFLQPGIVLLNFQSVKGLEFDVLLLPGGESSYLRFQNHRHKMAVYVQTSRPRFDLRLLYSAEHLPDIVQHIPADLYRHHVVS